MTVYVVVDDDDARKKLTRLADAVSPNIFRTFLDERVELHFRRRMADRFSQGGDSATGKWAPLSQATIDTKSRQGLLSGINTATGDMRDFLVGGTLDADIVGGDVQFVYPSAEPDPDVETRMVMAERGRKGRQGRDARGRFKKKSKGQPARPVLSVDESDMRFLTDAVYDSIEEYVR